MLLQVLLIMAIFALALKLLKAHHTKQKLPPGPLLPLPFWSHIPWIGYRGLTPPDTFDLLRRQYGDPFSVHLGSHRVVVISDMDTVKDVYAKKLHRRAEDLVGAMREHHYGVAATNGEEWKLQRKIFLRMMKETGFKKENMDRAFAVVWPKIRAMLQKKAEDGFRVVTEDFELLLVELSLYIVADPDLFPKTGPPKELLHILNVNRKLGLQRLEGELWYQFPMLKHFSNGYKRFMADVNACKDMFEDLVNRHHSGLDSSYDFIDAYLEKLAETEDDNTTIENNCSNDNCSDLLRGNSGRKCLIYALMDGVLGADGMIMAFNNILCAMAHYQRVQQTIRSQGSEYAEAFVKESLRMFAQGGFGPLHQSDKPVSIGDYVIPAKMDVIPNLYRIQHDPKVWTDPHHFRPERFLTADDPILKQLTWLPFGIGHRHCPARQYATDMLVSLTRQLAAEFNLKLADPTQVPVDDQFDCLEFQGTILFLPKEFSMFVESSQKRRMSLMRMTSRG